MEKRMDRLRRRIERELGETRRLMRSIHRGLHARKVLTEKRVPPLIPQVEAEPPSSLRKLRASDALCRQIVETAPMGIWVIDAEAIIRYANDSMAELHGREPSELVGRSIFDFLEVTHRAQAEAQLERRRQGIREQIDFPIQHRDGSTRLCSFVTSSFFDRAGHYMGALGMATDITARRRTEERLRRSESQLAEAQQLSQIGSWDWDLVNDTVEWSEELYRIFGRRRDSFGPNLHSFIECVHPDDRERVQSSRAHTSLDQQPFESHYLALRPTGEVRRIFSRGRVIVDESGRPVRMVGTTQDVTDRTQAEELLKESNEQLQALSHQLLVSQEKERRHLAGELHDEFGQILATIGLNLLQATSRAPPEILAPLKEAAALIEQAGAQIRSLAFELRPTMLDVLGLEPTLRWLVERHAGKTGISIEMRGHLSGNALDPELASSCYRLVQEALTNILRHARARSICVELKQFDTHLEIAVQDDGTGFDLGAVRRSAARAGCFGLMGMAERVKSRGGRMEIETAPGRGTRLVFSMPTTASSHHADSPPPGG